MEKSEFDMHIFYYKNEKIFASERNKDSTIFSSVTTYK